MLAGAGLALCARASSDRAPKDSRAKRIFTAISARRDMNPQIRA
jgi:hypothetical protein